MNVQISLNKETKQLRYKFPERNSQNGLEVSELQSHSFIHFLTNTLGNGMNATILPAFV